MQGRGTYISVISTTLLGSSLSSSSSSSSSSEDMIIVLLFVVMRSRVGGSMGVKVEDVELFEATDFVGLSIRFKTRIGTHDGLRSRSTKFRVKIYVSHETFSTKNDVEV